MKTIFSITLFVFAIMLAGCNEEPSRKACENGVLATVRDLTGLEGCGFVFELADGQRLEPYGLIFFYCPTEPCPKSPLTKEMMENPLYNFEFVDSNDNVISSYPNSIPKEISLSNPGQEQIKPEEEIKLEK